MRLRKVRTVAEAEFGNLTRSKVFVLSLLLVPALSLGLGCFSRFLGGGQDLTVRRFAVLDRTGLLYPALARAASQGEARGHFMPVDVSTADARGDQARRWALDRFRRGALSATVEIPADAVLAPHGLGGAVRYSSYAPVDGALRDWLMKTLNLEVRRRRLLGMGVDPRRILDAEKPLNWVDGGADASRGGPGPPGAAVTGPMAPVVPVVSMLLLFLMVMLTAPQMMSSVIEEKMSRISEVLLSSVTPFELMIGKLTACCGVSVVVGAAYLAAGLWIAERLGYGGMVGVHGVVLFLAFLVLAIFLHGSLYMAVGAACSQPKDAQGMLAPLVLLTAAPFAVLEALVRDPSGPLAAGLSYFPLSAPFVMCFRLNTLPGPAAGEVVVSVGLTLLATFFCVWAASRIFRIGLLAQGKAPGPARLFRWVFLD